MRTLLFLCCLLLSQTSQSQTRQINLQTWKMGFADQSGNTLLPMEYDFLPLRFDSLMVARKGSLRGVVDDTGGTRIPFEYHNIQLLPGGWAMVTKDQSAQPVWGLVNHFGKLVLPLAYEYIAVVDSHLLAARFFNSKELNIFNASGQLLFKTEGATAMPGFDAQSVLIQKANRSTYWVNLRGEQFSPPLFENTIWSDGQYFIQNKNQRFGVVNAQGTTVVPFQYRGLTPQHRGHFSVTDSTYRNALVDAGGETLAEGEYIRWGKQPDAAYSKRWSIEFTSKVYDAAGKLLLDDCTAWPLITDLKWNKLPENNYENYNWIEFKKTKLQALYAADGRQILPPKFKQIKYCTDRHPLLAFSLDDRNYSGMVYGFDGNPMMEQRYFSLDFTEDPRILIGKKTHDGLFGFIDLREPEQAQFVYNRVDWQPDGSYIGNRDAESIHLSASGEILPAGNAPASRSNLQEVEQIEPSAPMPDDAVYQMADIMKPPAFPGGETALNQFLAGQLKYPAIARENGVQGMVVIGFIVEKNGRITDIKILRDIGGGCGQEASRLVKSMPNWTPGIKNGQPVRTRFTLPVRFKLN